MIAIGFANLVFAAYVSYLLAERGSSVYKSRRFWLMLLGLAISVYISWYVLLALPGITA